MEPLVSICCLTYNHELYIRDTIEGFLIQKTTFPIEVLIHDDASTDKTAEIIKEYELKYPNLIKPIYQLENQYSKGVSVSATYNFPRAKGKYIALCEGDDYWIDSLKLQKQVDFLEENQDYGLSHGNCNLYYQKSGKIVINANNQFLNLEPIKNANDLFHKLIKWEYIIRTATVVFRKDLLEQIPKNSINFQMGDTPLWLD
ncbi:MAG: glycosyltransferase, partial [Tissierellia bacterium]|nr:glycosyltransferase [Tissierellia bacterium]